MKISVIWPGRTRERNLARLEDDYLKRIRRFHAVERQVFKEAKGSDPRRKTIQEGEVFLGRIGHGDHVIAMSEDGQLMDSREFAMFLEKQMTYGTRNLAFLVGGENGFSKPVTERADTVLSLSRLTLTHEWARVLLLEQIYRAFTLIRNVPYQR